MDETTLSLPRWDLTPLYPGPDSPAFVGARDAAIQTVAALVKLFDAHGVGRHDPISLDETTVRVVDEVITRYNDTFLGMHRLEAYLQCLVATDVGDAVAQSALADLRQQSTQLARLDARLTAWIGSLDVEDLITRSTVAHDHAFAVRQAHRRAAHLMSPAEEELAADLGPTGGIGWVRLRDDIEAGLVARLELDGEERDLGMGELQALASHPDRAVRARAHATEIAAWRTVVVPVAAALNGIKGETIALTTRRGWTDPLEPMLVANHIDIETLEALLVAVREAYPDFRRYLRILARALHLPVLAAYDLFAPIGASARSWPFATAAAFITEQFHGYSPRLGALAERAIQDRWIDAEPRPGKVAGGFCQSLDEGASRILLNYAPTYDWMSGLAHEFGHAYHVAVQHERGRTWLQRAAVPMTLAETASTFCEVLIQRAARREADAAEEMSILGGWLLTAGLNVFQTMSAFDFERRLFADRRRRELGVEELNALVLEAQRAVFSDAIEAETLSPYLWAAVPHFYATERWFYNFPYAFGLLFGLGLFARYEDDPWTFAEELDGLLADTGMAQAAELAERFGIDTRTPAFWRSGLDVIRQDVDRFEMLVALHGADAGPLVT